MSQRKISNEKIVRVVSEPGDATRYDYYVMKDGPDNYIFAPCRSTFRFPQRINYYEGVNARNDDAALDEIADREFCNPWTVRECIEAMIEMEDRG